MSKAEVCAFLGKSVRTVVGYISSGALAASYVNGPHGREARIERASAERLKAEIETPSFRAVTPTRGVHAEATEMVASVVNLPVVFQQIAHALRPPEPARPWLTLAEAAEYSGLPASWLLGVARADAALQAEMDRMASMNGGESVGSVVARHPVRVVAVNVGTAKRAAWRFNREALGHAA